MFSPAPLLPLIRRPHVALFLAIGALAGPLCLQAGAQLPTEEPPTPTAETEQAPPETEQTPPETEQTPAGQAPIEGNTTLDAPGLAVTPLAGAYGNAQRSGPEIRRAFLEARMRELMRRLGIVTLPTQDAILEFMSADEEGKRQVREAGRKLLNGVRLDAPPERLKALLVDYQNAITANGQRRERAQTALDAQVGYSLNPRLESLLWLLGVLGQGQSAFGPGVGTANQQNRREGNGAPEVQSREIVGIITAKSGAGETPVWLEIRDEGGHLWRLKPDATPTARQVLGRQINTLSLGARITARVGTPVPIPVLLAIIPDDADLDLPVTP